MGENTQTREIEFDSGGVATFDYLGGQIEFRRSGEANAKTVSVTLKKAFLQDADSPDENTEIGSRFQ